MLDKAIQTLKLAQGLEDRSTEERRDMMRALVMEGRATCCPAGYPSGDEYFLNLEIDGIKVGATDSDQLIENWRIAAILACS